MFLEFNFTMKNIWAGNLMWIFMSSLRSHRALIYIGALEVVFLKKVYCIEIQRKALSILINWYLTWICFSTDIDIESIPLTLWCHEGNLPNHESDLTHSNQRRHACRSVLDYYVFSVIWLSRLHDCSFPWAV